MIFGRQNPDVIWNWHDPAVWGLIQKQRNPGVIRTCVWLSGQMWLRFAVAAADVMVLCFIRGPCSSQIQVSLNKRLNARLLLGASSWVYKCVWLVMAVGMSVNSELSLSRPESCCVNRVLLTFLRMYWIWSTHPVSWWSIYRCLVECHKFCLNKNAENLSIVT